MRKELFAAAGAIALGATTPRAETAFESTGHSVTYPDAMERTYRALISPLVRDVDVAEMASSCSLRSPEFGDRVDNIVTDAITTLAERIARTNMPAGTSNDDVIVVRQILVMDYANLKTPNPVADPKKCKSLAARHALDTVDRIAREGSIVMAGERIGQARRAQ